MLRPLFAVPLTSPILAPRYQPIDRWHVCISGFRQHRGSPTGLEALWQRLRAAHHNGVAAVELCAWNDNWSALAEFIWRFRRDGQPPRIGIYAYSWGAGWGFIQLARQLRRRGLEVQHAVLSDPVYRHWYRAGNWRAFVPGIPIEVPANVRRVQYFVQRQNWPRGHRVIAADATQTAIWAPITLNADHEKMDDADEFHETSLVAANQLKANHERPGP